MTRWRCGSTASCAPAGCACPRTSRSPGYDNYRAIAETLFPPLTTVELPYADMGARAADLLMRLIRGKTTSPASPVQVPGPVSWRLRR